MNEMRQGFLMMPFDSKLDWLHDQLKEAASEVDIELIRADDISQPGIIIQQILDSIESADVIVAVCIDKNPNVFFELGYSWHTHDPVLIAKSKEDLPFDVSAYRTIMNVDKFDATWKIEFKRNLMAAARLRGKASGNDLVGLAASVRRTSGPYSKLVISNRGNVAMNNITVELPSHVQTGFLVYGDLPIDRITPGSSIELNVSTSGVAATYFTLKVVGDDDEGNSHSFESTVSII